MEGVARRACSRAGCDNVETDTGQFLRCSRCKSALYCSRACQKADFCSAGHTSCALGHLVEAGARGDWSIGSCKQAVRLLQANPASPHTVPILEAIQSTLSHPQPLAMNSHTHLFNGGLLPALLAVVQHLGTAPHITEHPRPPATPPPKLATFTAVVSTMLALGSPGILLLLISPSDPAAAAACRTLLLTACNDHTFASWLVLASVFVGRKEPCTGGLPLGAVSGFVMALSFLLGCDTDTCERDPATYFRICNNTHACIPANAPLIYVALLGAMLLSAVRLKPPVAARFFVSNPKAGRSGPIKQLKTFLAPLHHVSRLPPATSPDAQMWRYAVYQMHLSALQELGQWMASVEGRAGLKVLAAGGLAEAAAVVLDTLLFLEGPLYDQETAPQLVDAALHVAAHMAATSEGRACLAVDWRLCKWLGRAPELGANNRRGLAVLACSCVFDWVGEARPYWCKLWDAAGGRAASGTDGASSSVGGLGAGAQFRVLWASAERQAGPVEPLSAALQAQLAAPEGQAAIAALLSNLTEESCQGTLITAIHRVLQTGPSSTQLRAAVAAYARSSAGQREAQQLPTLSGSGAQRGSAQASPGAGRGSAAQQGAAQSSQGKGQGGGAQQGAAQPKRGKGQGSPEVVGVAPSLATKKGPSKQGSQKGRAAGVHQQRPGSQVGPQQPAARDDLLMTTPQMAAVLADPAHGEFISAAHLAATTKWSSTTCRGLWLGASRGAGALPTGISPRQAAIAAAYLAHILAGTFLGSARDVRALLEADTHALARIVAPLLEYGVLSRDAAATVAPQEVGGRNFGALLPIPDWLWQQGGQELEDTQRLVACPRYVTLVGLSALHMAGWGAALEVAGCNLGDRLLRPELLDWALWALADGAHGLSVLHHAIFKLEENCSAKFDTVREMLRGSAAIEPALMRFADRWPQKRKYGVSTGQDYERELNLMCIVGVYGAAAQASSQWPAPLFLSRLADQLLQVMQGAGYMQDAPSRSGSCDESRPCPESDGGSGSGTTSRSCSRLRAARDSSSAAASRYDFELLQPLFDLKRHTSLAAAEAEGMPGFMIFRMLKLQMTEPEVVQHVVSSGLGLRLVEAALKLKPPLLRASLKAVAAAALTGPNGDSAAGTRAASEDSEELVALKQRLAEQVVDRVDSDPAFLDALLSCKTGMQHHVGSSIWPVLDRASTSPATSSTLLLQLALPTLRLRGVALKDVNDVKPGHMRAASQALVNTWAVGLALEAGQALLVMAALVSALQDACVIHVLEPCWEEIVVLGHVNSPDCRLASADLPVARKLALWALGLALETRAQTAVLMVQLQQEQLWEYVARAANHALSGEQLQRMYGRLKEQGYDGSSPGQRVSFVDLRQDARDARAGMPATPVPSALLIGDAWLGLVRFLISLAASSYSSLPCSRDDFVRSILHPAASAVATLSIIEVGRGTLLATGGIRALVSVVVASADVDGRSWQLGAKVWGGAHWSRLLDTVLVILRCRHPMGRVIALAALSLLLPGAEAVQLRGLLWCDKLLSEVRQMADAGDGSLGCELAGVVLETCHKHLGPGAAALGRAVAPQGVDAGALASAMDRGCRVTDTEQEVKAGVLPEREKAERLLAARWWEQLREWEQEFAGPPGAASCSQPTPPAKSSPRVHAAAGGSTGGRGPEQLAAVVTDEGGSGAGGHAGVSSTPGMAQATQPKAVATASNTAEEPRGVQGAAVSSGRDGARSGPASGHVAPGAEAATASGSRAAPTSPEGAVSTAARSIRSSLRQGVLSGSGAPGQRQQGHTTPSGSAGEGHAQPSGSTDVGPTQSASGESGSNGSAIRMSCCAACQVPLEQALVCSACLSVRYCGAECQRAHWKQHKALCKRLRAAGKQ